MWKIMRENLEDLTSPNLWRSAFAELVGTLLLVLFGCGTATNQQTQYVNITVGSPDVAFPPSIVQIALTFGLIVGTVVWCIAHVSGGHINPAVTLGALITRRVSIVRALIYIASQLVGAMVGAGILYGITPLDDQGTLGVNMVQKQVTEAQGFGVELMITFVLVLTVLASTDQKRKDLNGSAPLTIGLAVAVGHLFSIAYTGCSMNPARSFGPAVVTNMWQGHWVFWIGPMVGGFVAALLYEYVFSAGATLGRTTRCLTRCRAPPAEKKEQEPEKMEIIEIEEKKEPEPEQPPEEDQPLLEEKNHVE